MIEFIEWPKKVKNPIGKVIKVFGESGEHLSEINSIMSEYNLSQNSLINDLRVKLNNE